MWNEHNAGRGDGPRYELRIPRGVEKEEGGIGRFGVKEVELPERVLDLQVRHTPEIEEAHITTLPTIVVLRLGECEVESSISIRANHAGAHDGFERLHRGNMEHRLT